MNSLFLFAFQHSVPSFTPVFCLFFILLFSLPLLLFSRSLLPLPTSPYLPLPSTSSLIHNLILSALFKLILLLFIHRTSIPLVIKHFDPLATRSLVYSYSLPFFPFFFCHLFSFLCLYSLFCHCLFHSCCPFSLSPFHPPSPIHFHCVYLPIQPSLPFHQQRSLVPHVHFQRPFVYESTLAPSLSYMTHSQHHPCSFCALILSL
ncbi:MAG: hypothetical protein JOS17DRAFT_497055 [Linnemannia elongata]|nr:MAG: hypothetical protein JOS17DRAFT_497055 [Linnemannia elongata]